MLELRPYLGPRTAALSLRLPEEPPLPFLGGEAGERKGGWRLALTCWTGAAFEVLDGGGGDGCEDDDDGDEEEEEEEDAAAAAVAAAVAALPLPSPSLSCCSAASAQTPATAPSPSSCSAPPILGICGGHQLINLAFGGRLIQHLPQAVAHTGGKSHPIDIRNGRILRELFGEGRLDVNSWHHQAVPLDGLGQGLVATAFADDGIVEALEGTDPSRFLLGVQWHPERSPDPEHCRQLLGALIQAAAARVRG